MHANAHCALSRDARTGLPATMTVTGFVCSCGKLPHGNPAAALDGDRHFERVGAAVRRHFAARHDAAVDHHFDEALLAQVQRIRRLLFADQDRVAHVAPAADGDRAAIGGLERGLRRKGDGGLDGHLPGRRELERVARRCRRP